MISTAIAYVKVIDTHAGSRSLNGGEYGFGRRLRNLGNGQWEVEHFTTSEFEWCYITGIFQRCCDCFDYDRESGECFRNPDIVEDSEVVGLIRKFGAKTCQDYDGLDYLEIDATGHEYTSCRFDGGCAICYPCGHIDCC